MDYSARGRVYNKQHDYTQEIRLQSKDQSARLTWVVGFLYANNLTQNQERIIDLQLNAMTRTLTGKSALQLFGRDLVGINGQDSYVADNKFYDGQKSLFGEVNFKITDKLKATGRVALARVALDQGGDVAVPGAADQIAFPVARNGVGRGPRRSWPLGLFGVTVRRPTAYVFELWR